MKRKMKSVILALALVVTSLAVNAQSFKKSDKFVEGTVSYTKTTDVDASYGITPTIGYFVTDRVAVGLFGEGTKAGDTKTTNIGAQRIHSSFTPTRTTREETNRITFRFCADQKRNKARGTERKSG
jgi:hypothetical protein